MKKLMLTAFLLVALPVALAQQAPPPPQTVFINGVALPATTITENGVVYYKLKADDLKRVGAITQGGVTPKIDAIKGCVGDTLLNGVYTVQLVNTYWDGKQFGVTLVIGNATKRKISIFSPGDVLTANTAGTTLPLSNYESWPYGSVLLSGAKTTVKTATGNTNQRDWTRLLIRPTESTINAFKADKLPLSKVYDMEFDLTCTKK